jgi:hypothetical protein
VPIVKALKAFFGGVRRRPKRRLDRRVCKRYRSLAVYCQVLAPGALRGVAVVVDLSALGAGLTFRGTVKVGTHLRLLLSNREQLLRHEVTLRVAHACDFTGPCCRVGGPFEEPLPPSVLQALMR